MMGGIKIELQRVDLVLFLNSSYFIDLIYISCGMELKKYIFVIKKAF